MKLPRVYNHSYRRSSAAVERGSIVMFDSTVSLSREEKDISASMHLRGAGNIADRRARVGKAAGSY